MWKKVTKSPDSSASNASDLSLLRRVKEGEGDAATELYVRYAKRLHGLARNQTSPALARRVEPDEIVQSVFRTFFRRVATDDYNVPEGKELWALLLVIALNKIRQAALFHRAARRDVLRTSSMEEVGVASFLNAEDGRDETALAVLRMVVDDLLETMPPTKRDMVRLRIDGFDVAEISDKVQRSKRTVERALQEFRDALSRLLTAGDAE